MPEPRSVREKIAFFLEQRCFMCILFFKPNTETCSNPKQAHHLWPHEVFTTWERCCTFNASDKVHLYREKYTKFGFKETILQLCKTDSHQESFPHAHNTCSTHTLCVLKSCYVMWGLETTLDQACWSIDCPSAICVQRFDDSLSCAIRITYRSSQRSSSIHEPRDPPLKVVILLFSNKLISLNQIELVCV